MNNKPQIFFLHFAGGNCYSYNFLKNRLGNNFELNSLELPGRGKRFSECALLDFNSAVIDYVNQIKQLRNSKPYLIYGHSMGATLGLFVTKQMERILDGPILLMVSGNAGPGAKEVDENGVEVKKEKRYLMNDSSFKEELIKLGGIPEEILENNELYAFFNPIMRSDFEILEKEEISQDIKLKTEIYALMGTEEVSSKSIENWRKFTFLNFQFKTLSGDHFFIHEHVDEIVTIINKYSKKNAVSQYIV